MEEVFASLNEYRPKEAEKVKGLLFTFEDIIKLRPEAVAKLFDQVPPERVILALFEADKGLTELILGALGSRSRRMIETGTDQRRDAAAARCAKGAARHRRSGAEAVRKGLDRHPRDEADAAIPQGGLRAASQASRKAGALDHVEKR